MCMRESRKHLLRMHNLDFWYLHKVDVLGELRMRCNVRIRYTHEPATLRVRSESTRWMDLLIHGPTWQIAEEGG